MLTSQLDGSALAGMIQRAQVGNEHKGFSQRLVSW